MFLALAHRRWLDWDCVVFDRCGVRLPALAHGRWLDWCCVVSDRCGARLPALAHRRWLEWDCVVFDRCGARLPALAHRRWLDWCCVVFDRCGARLPALADGRGGGEATGGCHLSHVAGWPNPFRCHTPQQGVYAARQTHAQQDEAGWQQVQQCRQS